uniref:Uncharacterized protein n=1 Tax=Sphaerodactylus townsendi TaxID=933632 RepID=A0ACB8FER9_9SAUR
MTITAAVRGAPAPACTVAGAASAPTPAPPAARSFFRHVRFENLVAGLSGGVVSTLVLHPLDLVKIRFAVSDGLQLRPKYNGQGPSLTCFIHECIWKPWKRVKCYNAIKAYKTEDKAENWRAWSWLNLPECRLLRHNGAMTLCITNPIWVTKTRLVLQYEAGVDPSKRQYQGMVDALIKIYKSEGIRGLYKGFVPGLFGTSHGALQFMAYEELKSKYNKHWNRPSDSKLSTSEYIAMAALSKIFAVSATYPYQVVRARLQDQHNRYSGVVDVIRRTWR